jgi:hypothetical protein
MSIIRFFFPILLSAHLIQAAGIREISNDSICTVARSSLLGFLEKIPPNYESRYGFSSRDEFNFAQPGTPLRLYSVNLDSKSSADTLSPVALNEWRVPVIVNGTIRSLLTLTIIDGSWQTVELGGAALAREIDNIDKLFHGCHRALLRVDQLRCDLILINFKNSDISTADCLPLKSATMFPDNNELMLLSQRAVLTELLKAFQQQSNRNE